MWTLPAVRFFGFNVVENIAVFYGRNRPDYYLTEGLPLLLTTALPFTIVGLYQALVTGQKAGAEAGQDGQAKQPDHAKATITTLKPLAVATLLMMSTLSLIGHKEVRFLHPLLPIFLILAAEPARRFLAFSPFPWPSTTSRTMTAALCIAINIFIAVYVSYVHQRGPLALMSYLRSQFIAVNTDSLALGERNAGPSSMFSAIATAISSLAGSEQEPTAALYTMSIAFLMPCHSTPWRSHLVFPEIKAWALTCEPPIGMSTTEREEYLDEADQFYSEPVNWLRENMGPLPTAGRPWEDIGWDQSDSTVGQNSTTATTNAFAGRGKRPWPRYVAFFEQLEDVIREATGGSRYRECWRTFNTHWHDDWRRQGDIIVWCVDGSLDEKAIVDQYDRARYQAMEDEQLGRLGEL